TPFEENENSVSEENAPVAESAEEAAEEESEEKETENEEAEEEAEEELSDVVPESEGEETHEESAQCSDDEDDIKEGRDLVDVFEENSDTRKIDISSYEHDDDGSEEDENACEYDDSTIFYNDEDLEERDYRPIRFSRTGRSGCLGGIMYAAFIICISVALAVFGWMAACDVLALNKGDVSMTVVMPEEIFFEKEVDVLDEDGNKVGTETVVVADVDKVSHILKDNGIIEYPWLFNLFAKVSNADENIDPGTYNLSTRFDYRALVKNLQESVAAKEIKSGVTFPEGYTMDQIFQKLEDEGICSVEDLYDAAANYHYDFSFLDDSTLGDPKRLEGFIFPNTYDFYVGESASSVISKFLNAFHRQLYADMYQLCDNMGITFYEAVIIASMIEKEAANDDERDDIASVIYNRIRSNMTLGIDATILYEHPEHVGVQIPTEILQEDSPYNTHIYKGLPPTPICNPGMASLEAALHPATTWYYYYALDTATGTHKFFYNQYEFNAFVGTQDYDNYNP
ncbi:MAG: endolytic transglycosylase MltG, partial [Oscillospiraceae bacterium]|nr:endolytic transglycosylase MltG [Oscillospiraceae bacterium]